ncbi:MAG: rhodanese-related sulfurtransferase [Defluviitaleaceae bacterium]|nr:rhodanese-related sulfurtransferase [Defluviitaleaceae bacterium]
MKFLHNTISNRQLKEEIKKEKIHRTTISFYKYFNLENPKEYRDNLYKKFFDLNVFGRVYIASEGINGQISVPTESIEKFKKTLYDSHKDLDEIRLNIAIEENQKSFWVLRMKVREKIVADGITDKNFSVLNTGKYLKAKEVNDMIEDTQTIFVDMRNHYEYEVGHFEGAIEVPSNTFREQLPMALNMLQGKKDKNIVMYCTGGIRCEKATAYMKHNGFENIYHIEGGIIEYARKAKEQGLPLKFIGKNFVFDERMGERITNDIISNCHQCGELCDSHINCANDNCHILFIQCEKCKEKYENCCSTKCTEIMKLSEEERKILRKGKKNDKLVFNKSKHNLMMNIN